VELGGGERGSLGRVVPPLASLASHAGERLTGHGRLFAILHSTVNVEQKLEQLYAALAEMQVTEKLFSIKPTTKSVGNQIVSSIDFTMGTDRATAANRVTLLLNNIACLKDHLKSWCTKNGKQFTGDQLIDSNRDVAIIHDLWNLDKHAELNGPSRSGLSPRLLQPAQTSLTFKSGGPEPTVITIPFFEGGLIRTQGEVSLRIVAPVVDKNGKQLGDLEPISLRAVAAWEAEFVKAGMTLVPPPERQKEYARLSGQLQAIGLRYKAELPTGATSLLMKVNDGMVLVEVYDKIGRKIGDLPDQKTSSALRDALQNTFQFAISPDHDGVVAII
jgi:hypothetical protein